MFFSIRFEYVPKRGCDLQNMQKRGAFSEGFYLLSVLRMVVQVKTVLTRAREDVTG